MTVISMLAALIQMEVICVYVMRDFMEMDSTAQVSESIHMWVHGYGL